MSRAVLTLTTLLPAFAVACGGAGSSASPSTTGKPQLHPLAALAATGAIVTPTFAVRAAPELNWSARLGSNRDILRTMDDDIASSFAVRGLKRGWILPADLALSYKRNPTYAADPYGLAEEQLRSPALAAGSRLSEPLASQLRTMIALHENARYVLVPIELRFDTASGAPGAARAALHVALIDPRYSQALWVGDVRADTTSADPRALTAALARRIPDLIVGQ